MKKLVVLVDFWGLEMEREVANDMREGWRPVVWNEGSGALVLVSVSVEGKRGRMQMKQCYLRS